MQMLHNSIHKKTEKARLWGGLGLYTCMSALCPWFEFGKNANSAPWTKNLIFGLFRMRSPFR